jgi:glutathione S-transferase
MPIILYDLAGANPALRFSPYCWRTKLALHHKELEFQAFPHGFTDRGQIAKSGQSKVPVIDDDGRLVHDSWKIALYLDETYPDRPLLFPDAAARSQAKFINSWCDWSLLPNMRTLMVPEVIKVIAEADKAYFRTSREKALGMPLEQVGADREAAMKTFLQGLKPAAVTLDDQDFLHGAKPGYGDMALFGTLMWPFTLCPTDPIDRQSAIGKWFERMLAFNPWAAKALTVRSLVG